ncbi:Matrilysin, variant 2 [Trifolium repens]|nr:Matrilysin, variant 2 [Trifolium repens]
MLDCEERIVLGNYVQIVLVDVKGLIYFVCLTIWNDCQGRRSFRTLEGHCVRATSGLRIGLYEPVKTFYTGKDHVGDVPLSKKILAAFTTGAVAIAVANPTDLVKVRLQAEGKLPPGVPKRYSGSLNAYSSIVRQEGVRSLWTGLGPNIARNSIINAAELASYDQVKQTILKIPGFTDDVVTHLFAGLGAVLSAYGDTKLVMKGISHGACDYLLKPVRLEELKNIWQHVIRKKKSDPKEKSKTCKPDKTVLVDLLLKRCM